MPIADSSLSGMLAVFGLGHWEIVIVVLVVLLLFGGRKLPEIARGIARGLRIFKDEMKGIKTDVEDSVTDDSDTEPAGNQQLPPDKPQQDEKNPHSG